LVFISDLETIEKRKSNKKYLDDDQIFVDIKKPYSMPAKRLGKHRAFELYSLAKPMA